MSRQLEYFIAKGSKVIETEFGWLNYFDYEKYYYLENIFIYPEFQGSKKAVELWKMFLDDISPGKFILGTIALNQKIDVTKNLSIYFSKGFKIHSATSDTIFIKHEGKK